MNKLGVLLKRNVLLKNKFVSVPPNFFEFGINKNKSSSSSSSSSSSTSTSGNSSDSDNEEKQKPVQVKKKNEALEKLNVLLQKMVKEDAVNYKSGIKLAQPVSKRKKTSEGDVESRKIESVERQMVNAVKDVAESIGGDSKQTESELLIKLLSPDQLSKETSATNLSDIVKGMKIDRETKPVEQRSRAEQVKEILNRVGAYRSESRDREEKPKRFITQKRGPELVVQKINLFGGKPLEMFTDKANLQDSVQNKTWQKLYDNDLKLATTHPPANYFQQMILWTNQGKIWKFPIDNEQGLEEEKNVCFSEHVFLEKHLEPWCPQKGPIRHFMELVCVGLSKNPYLTVDAKKEHIEWYKDYFESKKQLLQEVGAMPAVSKTQSPKSLEK